MLSPPMGHGPAAFKEADVTRAVHAITKAWAARRRCALPPRDGGFFVVIGKPGETVRRRHMGRGARGGMSKIRLRWVSNSSTAAAVAQCHASTSVSHGRKRVWLPGLPGSTEFMAAYLRRAPTMRHGLWRRPGEAGHDGGAGGALSGMAKFLARPRVGGQLDLSQHRRAYPRRAW